MTATTTTTTTPLTEADLSDLSTPELGQTARKSLIEALVAAANGSEVTIAVRYEKQTSAKARIAGEDYKALLSVSHDVLEGRVLKVARNKKGSWYVLMDAITRRTKEGKPGWTNIKGEGIVELIGTDIAKDTKPEAQ
jgi:hypothetical protein